MSSSVEPSNNSSEQWQTRPKAPSASSESTPQSSEAPDASSSSPETPQTQTETDQLRAVSDLLGSLGEGADQPPTPRSDEDAPGEAPAAPEGAERGEGAEGAPDPAPAPPASLSEAAERLGMEPSELYKLKLTTGDGETVSLGEIKDAWQDRAARERETAQRATELDTREAAVLADQRLWGELGDQLGQTLSAETRTQLQERLAERDRVERRKTLEAMPELADPARFDAFRDRVAGELEGYGYKPHEIVVGDHRHLVILRDLIRMKDRLAKLEEYRPEKPLPKAAKPRKPPPRSQVKPNAAASEAEKVSAVSQLLRGG